MASAFAEESRYGCLPPTGQKEKELDRRDGLQGEINLGQSDTNFVVTIANVELDVNSYLT